MYHRKSLYNGPDLRDLTTCDQNYQMFFNRVWKSRLQSSPGAR